MTVDLSDALKAGMRQLASGVCVISAWDKDQTPYAMTASSVTSVSASPASLLVCVNQSARMKVVLKEGVLFAVNVLSDKHEEVSTICSSSDQASTRFEVGQWQLDPKAPPMLKDALAVFECKVTEVHPYGSHNIVIGDVVAVNTPARGRPLLYHDGGYASLHEA